MAKSGVSDPCSSIGATADIGRRAFGSLAVSAAAVWPFAARALHDAFPAVYQYRPFAAAGGLVSYGASETEYYRLLGVQVGKILNGTMPADLPLEQTKIEMIINLKTAKVLGISVPLELLGRADEVIE